LVIEADCGLVKNLISHRRLCVRRNLVDALGDATHLRTVVFSHEVAIELVVLDVAQHLAVGLILFLRGIPRCALSVPTQALSRRLRRFSALLGDLNLVFRLLWHLL